MEITIPREPAIIRVGDATHAGEARRKAVSIAERLSLGERASSSLSLVVTEMVTNIVKHAGNGTLLLDSIAYSGNRGMRVLALDKGPGIKDLNAALRDGHSTAGTPGNGLGAIKRLSDVFDIHSSPGSGTAVMAEVWSQKLTKEKRCGVEVAVVSLPIKGEEVCGDGWGAKEMPGSALLMVVDGLGHGVLAAEAAREAERIFESARPSPTSILQDSHLSLKKTRGAAMAVASLDFERELVSYAGVGNISASLVGPQGSRGIASHNGTIGHEVRNIQEFSLPWKTGNILVMHSDGLNTRWDLAQYPGIWSKHPALIAGVLYRDFSRDRDDVTVLVAKDRQEANIA